MSEITSVGAIQRELYNQGVLMSEIRRTCSHVRSRTSHVHNILRVLEKARPIVSWNRFRSFIYRQLE